MACAHGLFCAFLAYPQCLTPSRRASAQVLAFFTQHDSANDDGTGLSLAFVAQGLASFGIAEKEVRAAVDFLANEGHLYSTIDDNHYKSTA